jgi:hypothetical protein
LLIPKKQALKILQLPDMDDAAWRAFVKQTNPNLFMVTPGTAITNASLSTYLGLSPPPGNGGKAQ